MNKLSLSCIRPALLILFFFQLLLPFQADAEEKNSPRVEALKLQKLYGGLSSLTFDFRQTTRSGGRERTGSGNAIFVKIAGQAPAAVKQDNALSAMRWNYTDPDRQVIINDGHTLSIYTEQDKQLIKTSAKELESDITYAFFTGTRNLLDDFDPEPGTNNFIFSTSQQLQSIRLLPRQPHNQVKSIQIWYDSDGIIRHLMIEDHFESITELNFNNIKINSIPDVNEDKLNEITSLTIPPDTEIITQ